MLLKWGNYSYSLYAAGLTISSVAELNDAQEPVRYVDRIRVTTHLKNPGTTRAQMNSAVQAFKSAHRASGYNLILYQPDGTTPTTHAWYSNACLGGVRVVGQPSFPEYEGAEAINYRTITVEFEAIQAIPGRRSNLRSFNESLRFSGGGPRIGFLEPLNGPPIKQQLKAATLFMVTQQGQAVGLIDYPSLPPPIWPQALLEAPDIGDGGCQRVGNDFSDFAISWLYRFGSASPLVGRATRWAIGA